MEPVAFASAYRQLRPSERAYVDGYVQGVEREAHRNHERISNALYRPIAPDVVEASRGMLERPLVRAAISERINDLARDSELTVPRVLKELMAVSFASIGDYMEVGDDGQPYFNLASATPEQLAAIKSIEIEESGSPMERSHKRKFKFTLHDKLGGLAMLTKFMGMLDADNPHWRNDNARPAAQGALPGGTSVEGAGDRWAQMING
jgi:hypothetical protein